MYRNKKQRFNLLKWKSLSPVFPDAWKTKENGEFEVTPRPYNIEPPYLYHGSKYGQEVHTISSKTTLEDQILFIIEG